jgi:DNA replication initiation complex subunit (GINS family)
MKIDYDELRRIHRLEKNTSKLVEVDEDFIDSLEKFVEEEKRNYLSSLKNFSSSEVREFTNLKRIIEDIFQMREKKLLNKALIGVHTKEVSTEKMARQEEETFNKILKVLQSHNDIHAALFGEKEREESVLTSIKILKDVPTFVGTDMQEYGPYSEGAKIKVPAKIAKLLVMRKIAEED